MERNIKGKSNNFMAANAEDDLSLIEGLKYTLEKNGFQVDNARTVKEAYQFFRSGRYDLLLLDVTLPDGTGFDICKEVRKTSAVPIIYLTASDEEISIIRGLDMGGDDYITKPFKLGEVLSRINALLRRFAQFNKSDMILESNGIRIDMSERVCWKGETELPLTLVEYKLLCQRIDSEETGDWYSLFHRNNELAAILSAQAEHEKQTRNL